MQTARRLYLYVMSLVALGVAAAGLYLVLETIARSADIFREAASYSYGSPTAQAVSQGIAFLAVGIPVWAVHWYLAQRGLAPERAGSAAERGSALRAVYLTLVLTITFVVLVTGFADAFRALVLPMLDQRPERYYYQDGPSAFARAVVAAIGWGYHAVVRRSDLRGEAVAGPAAWIPRLYLYGMSLLALVIAITSLEAVVSVVRNTTVPGSSSLDVVAAVDHLSVAVLWATGWWLHWRYALRVTKGDDWRAVDERRSKTRLAAYVATIAVAAYFTIDVLALIGRVLVVQVLGANDDGVPRGDPIWALLAGLPSLLLWAGAWWIHARWLQAESTAQGPDAARDARRLEDHAVAAVGLGLGAIAIAWLLGLTLDGLLGGVRLSGTGFGQSWRYAVAGWVPEALIGTVVWLVRWSGIERRRRAEPDREANAVVRRGFLYLTLAVALISALGSATLILYRLVGSALGASLSGNTVSELSTPLGALITAAAVLLYHGLLLRRDQAARREPAPAEAEPVEAAPTAVARQTGPAASAVNRRTIVLVGNDSADMDAAVAALRAALPEGIEVVESRD